MEDELRGWVYGRRACSLEDGFIEDTLGYKVWRTILERAPRLKFHLFNSFSFNP